MRGTEFLNSLPEHAGPEREERILQAVLDGHYHQIPFCEVKLEGGGHTGSVEVSTDALMIGDEDPVRVSVSHPTAQRVADHLGCVLVTAKLSDQIWLQSDYKLPACTQTPDSHMRDTERMRQHHECVQAAADAAGAKHGDLIAPVGKDWANTNRLIGRADRSAEYGLHSPSALHQGVTPGVRVWQPGPSLAHVAEYDDYVTGKMRFVLRWMSVGSSKRDIEEVARDPQLHWLVSSEGTIQNLRHPAVPRPGEESTEAVAPDTLRPAQPLLARTLRRGMIGDDVSVWQQIAGAVADGVFGRKTEAATKRWQDARGLKDDGIVGPRTRKLALAELRDGAPEPVTPRGTRPAEPDVLNPAFVQAANYRWANRELVHWIVLHCMEAPEKPSMAEAVARWFAGLSGEPPRASANYCIDNDSVVCCVREEHVAWHAKKANRFGVGYEHAGYARQSRAEWLDDYSESMLWLSARLAAEVTIPRWGLPVNFVDRDGLRSAYADYIDRGLPVPDELRGFTTHNEVTHGLGGSHVDPGKHFPLERYLDMVREAA